MSPVVASHRGASRVRLIGLGVAAAACILVPAVATAQQDDDSTTTTTTPGPTTTLVPLVTSPPPTVAPPTTVVVPEASRTWPVPVPSACDAPPLPDVVFVGTVQATDYRTGRFRIDQVRAGAIERFAFGDVVDVRYDIDAKYLELGEQYLVGASVDPDTAALTSRITAPDPLFGGDEIIGEAETDVECPILVDPVRTLSPNGLPVESGLITPMTEAKGDLLGSLLLPLGIALGVVLGLASLRWFLTGLGYGVGSLFRLAREPREVRAVRRTNLRARQPD